MNNDVITLLKVIKTTDEYGDMAETITRRTIFARPQSIGQSEFYQANAVGLTPEIKFVIEDFADYQGEKELEYQPFGGTLQRYDVIRTYRSGLNLEITCKRGIDNGTSA
jgi:SPP1 family predicted phage head-tail adaptor